MMVFVFLTKEIYYRGSWLIMLMDVKLCLISCLISGKVQYYGVVMIMLLKDNYKVIQQTVR